MKEKKEQNDKKKITWMLWISVVTVLLTVLLIIGVFQIYRKSIRPQKDESIYDRYYMMIVEDRKSDFWQAIYNGAYEAGLEQNVYVDLLGNNLARNFNKYELL